jgi:hypothetical protein
MSRASVRKAAAVIALLVVAGIGYPAIARAESKGEVNFVLGKKMLDRNDWEPNEDQGEFGAEVTWGGSDWPIAFATDLVASSHGGDIPGFRIEAQTSELAFGVRKIWEAGPARPYVGGGIAKMDAQLELNSALEDDTVLGGWVGAGIFWRLGPRFNIGLAGRVSRGKVTLFGAEIEAGGTHAGLLLGWGWPAKK